MIVSNVRYYERFWKMAQYTPEELDRMFDINAAPAFVNHTLTADQEQALSAIWQTARELADRVIVLTPDDDPQSREAVDSVYQLAMHATAAAAPAPDQPTQ